MADTHFLLAQVAAPWMVGPFTISRSIDIGTLIGGLAMLFGLLRLLRSLEKWKELITGVLFGTNDPNGQTLTVGLVEKMQLIGADVQSLRDECPLLREHRRSEDGDEVRVPHRRSSDRAQPVTMTKGREA